MRLRVYRIPFSTNVERVALAAGHKGLALEWVDVEAADRSQVERVSGQSLVPVLVTLGVLLVVINIGSAMWDAYSDRERIFQDVQRDVSNITSLLAEQTASGLEAVDLVLRDAQRLGPAAQLANAAPRLRDELMHLPQVAAPASVHFVASKRVKDGRTISEIKLLNQRERVTELARMLGGQSDAARKHAEAMLE